MSSNTTISNASVPGTPTYVLCDLMLRDPSTGKIIPGNGLVRRDNGNCGPQLQMYVTHPFFSIFVLSSLSSLALQRYYYNSRSNILS